MESMASGLWMIRYYFRAVALIDKIKNQRGNKHSLLIFLSRNHSLFCNADGIDRAVVGCLSGILSQFRGH